MNFNSTYGIAALVAAGIALTFMMTSEHKKIVESNLGGCHKNLASLCIDTTAETQDICAAGGADQCEDTRIKGTPA